jgi:hypothetical protein
VEQRVVWVIVSPASWLPRCTAPSLTSRRTRSRGERAQAAQIRVEATARTPRSWDTQPPPGLEAILRRAEPCARRRTRTAQPEAVQPVSEATQRARSQRPSDRRRPVARPALSLTQCPTPSVRTGPCPSDALDGLQQLGRTQDEWTYVTDLGAAWRNRLETSSRSRGLPSPRHVSCRLDTRRSTRSS